MDIPKARRPYFSMKKLFLFLLALVLCCGIAGAEDTGILGEPFPDFSVTDSSGNTFTLSEALEDHEAVLINLWATWCPPCRLEFPFLNEAYERYGDRVAFISLSTEETDTPEVIEAFRSAYGLSIPMGRDEGGVLSTYIGSGSIPVTVIVDRFGNAVFFHNMCFKSTREVCVSLEAVLGDGYTETAVLNEIPATDTTAAFPVSGSRKVLVENPDARQVFFRTENPEYRLEAYVVNDSIARLQIGLAASDDPYGMILYDANTPFIHELPTLLDADRQRYTLDVPMPEAQAESHLVDVCLYEFLHPESPDVLDVYLIPGEEYLDELCAALHPYGWVPDEENGGDSVAPDAPQDYILHVVDQHGDPVPGLYVNFCTDMACTTAVSGEDGTIVFSGAQDVYHVQMLKAPDGYSFDSEFALYIGREYGEWRLCIRKN